MALLGMIGVYCITNGVNGKQYVGWASDVERRWREHHNCGVNSALLLRRAMKKHGVRNFEFEVLEECDTAGEATAKEIEHIERLGTFEDGYNLTKGGEGSLGWKPSEETKRRISEARKGQSNPHLERAVTIDGIFYSTVKSAAKTLGIGYPGLVGKLARQRKHGFTEFTLNPTYPATKHSPETKAKMSQAKLGRARSDEAKKALSNGAKERYKEQLHPMCKSVTIDGVEYESIKDAAKQLGINYSTLRWRIQRDTNARSELSQQRAAS